ncbi:MAG: amidohydrolase family protein [Candidatus Aegiribacteria sp.]|nr:amidohydrolase family protein [Candidatus Aegiribacteria sp.]
MVHNTAMEKVLDVAGIIDNGKFFSGGFSIELENGLIESITRANAKGKWKNCIAMPGLIQTHIHLGQTLFRGMAEGRTLLPWLENRIWPFEASHTPDTLAVSVIQSLRELFSSGCTGLLDMGVLRYSEVAVDILRRSGTRALIGNSLMDVGPDWITEELSWLKEETERIKNSCGGHVTYAYTPRFALSCSDAIWEWLAELPAGIKRTTHASESIDEIRHPSIREKGGNIHFLDKRGFTGPDTLLAHCIHLQQGELKILQGSGTTAVHCPWTNLRLGSGIADVPAMGSSNIRVTVASDGAACNNRLDLAGDLRLAMGLASIKKSPAATCTEFWFNSASRSAALALGWKNTGRLSENFTADITLIEPSYEEWEELTLSEDPVKYILELIWPERIVLTMVAGKTVYRTGEFPTLPPLPLKLSEARRQVLDRAGAIPGNPLSK